MRKFDDRPPVQIGVVIALLVIPASFLYIYYQSIHNFVVLEFFHEISRKLYLYQIKESFEENKFLIYSSILISIGSVIVTIFYHIFEQVWSIIKTRFTMQVSLNNTEEMYRWLLSYIGKHAKEMMITSPSYKLQKVVRGDDSRISSNENEDKQPLYEFVPYFGSYILKWRGLYILMYIASVGDSIAAGWEKETFQLETLDLYALGTANAQKIMFQLLQEAIKSQLAKYREKVKVFTMGRWSGWEPMAREKRPLDTVILSDNVLTELLADVRRFLSRGDWYREHGVPFRRGYLLYGVPGSGKTSLITAIASEIDYNICVLSLSGSSIDDRELNHRIHSAPPRSIILLEDIDAIFVDRDTPQEKEERGNFVTFSGFLNALDGAAAASDGKLFFMTTNHIEKLDSALLRAGRCDYKVAFKHATKDQIGRCFTRFFPNASTAEVDTFVSEFPEHSVTIAQIQSHLLLHKKNKFKAIREAKLFYESTITTSNTSTSKLTIEDLLRRLSLSHYTKKFMDERYFYPSEIGPIGQNTLKKFGFTMGEITRFQRFWIDNDPIAVTEFAIATRTQIEKFYFEFCKDYVSKEEAIEFAASIPDDSISTTQLRVYLSKKVLAIGEKFNHASAMRDIEQLINPPLVISSCEKIHESVSSFIISAIRNNKLFQIDLECQNADLSNSELTTSENILNRFEEEKIVNTFHLSKLTEQDLKKFGIVKIGSLIRWTKLLKELE